MSDNHTSCANPNTESRAQEYKAGVYVPGNKATQAAHLLDEGSQGSWGYGLDQGEHRVSHLQSNTLELTIGQDVERIKTDLQGSHAQLGKPYPHREQEDRL